MFPAIKQIISWLALLVVAAADSSIVSTLSDSTSGDGKACAEIATAYAEWIANQGECLPAPEQKIFSRLTVAKKGMVPSRASLASLDMTAFAPCLSARTWP